jgi:hypothetical protein
VKPDKAEKGKTCQYLRLEIILPCSGRQWLTIKCTGHQTAGACDFHVGITEGMPMKTENIHPIKIIFGIPVSPDIMVECSAYAYVIDGERLCLIDTGDVIHAGMRYLIKVHTTAMEVFSEFADFDPMELCKQCVKMLGLPPFAANPLVLRSLLSHKETGARISLESIFLPFLEG